MNQITKQEENTLFHFTDTSIHTTTMAARASMTNTIELLQDVDMKIASARNGIDNVICQIKADRLAEMQEQKPAAAATRQPTPNKTSKRFKIETVDLGDPDDTTWHKFFNYKDSKILNMNEKANAQAWTCRLIELYEDEIKSLQELHEKSKDGIVVNQYDIIPLRQVVKLNMMQGRNHDHVKYIGMVGLLTTYNDKDGQDAHLMTNREFQFCVSEELISKLTQWRKVLYEHRNTL
jgi:hypothetical protein